MGCGAKVLVLCRNWKYDTVLKLEIGWVQKRAERRNNSQSVRLLSRWLLIDSGIYRLWWDIFKNSDTFSKISPRTNTRTNTNNVVMTALNHSSINQSINQSNNQSISVHAWIRKDQSWHISSIEWVPLIPSHLISLTHVKAGYILLLANQHILKKRGCILSPAFATCSKPSIVVHENQGSPERDPLKPMTTATATATTIEIELSIQ